MVHFLAYALVFIVSVLALVVVSYMTPPPSEKVLDQVFKPEAATTGS